MGNVSKSQQPNQTAEKQCKATIGSQQNNLAPGGRLRLDNYLQNDEILRYRQRANGVEAASR